MQIHFLAYGVGNVHKLDAWSDRICSLSVPDDLPHEMRRVLEQAERMDAWLERMKDIIRYKTLCLAIPLARSPSVGEINVD